MIKPFNFNKLKRRICNSELKNKHSVCWRLHCAEILCIYSPKGPKRMLCIIQNIRFTLSFRKRTRFPWEPERGTMSECNLYLKRASVGVRWIGNYYHTRINEFGLLYGSVWGVVLFICFMCIIFKIKSESCISFYLCSKLLYYKFQDCSNHYTLHNFSINIIKDFWVIVFDYICRKNGIFSYTKLKIIT